MIRSLCRFHGRRSGVLNLFPVAGLVAAITAIIAVGLGALLHGEARAEPPSTTGRSVTTIDSFDDVATPFGKTLVNRWQVPVGEDPWTASWELGTPWLSGGGIWQVATPYGQGFRFVVTPEMVVSSGGKKAHIVDISHLVGGVGITETWSGRVMFPKRGNPDGFARNFPSWNVFLNFHSAEGVPLQMGIDTTNVPRRNHIYIRLAPIGSQPRTARARSALVYGHWYSWRIVVRWSAAGDGRLRWWLDDRLRADWSGPTLGDGEVPYLQFGFYSTPQLRNEVLQAALRRS